MQTNEAKTEQRLRRGGHHIATDGANPDGGANLSRSETRPPAPSALESDDATEWPRAAAKGYFP
jgi:hypothetical protein